MKIVYSLIVIGFLAASGAMTERANAQSFDRTYAKALILAGNGTDNVNAITLLAPTLSPLSPYSLTLPVANASGVLTNNGSGGLSWGTAGLTNPMTTLGDIIYENSTPAPTRLAGNTTGTKEFLTQTGTGSVSAVPAWGAIAASDISTIGVEYGPSAVQNTLSTGTTDLFDVSYAGTPGTTVNGALINSTSSGTNVSATGLNITTAGATAGGTVKGIVLSSTNGSSAATTYDIYGTSGNWSMTAGGVLKAASAALTATSNQLVLGTTNTLTITASPAASETYTIPNTTTGEEFAITSTTPTSNTLPKYNSTAGLITNSTLSDNGTTVSLTASGEQLSFLGTSTGTSTFQAGAQGTNTYNYTLPITTPTANQVLAATAVGGATPYAVTLGWASAMTNPMTTTGDIIYGSTTATPSTPQRLGIGTTGQFLGSSGTIPQWSNTLTDNSIGTGITTYGLTLTNTTVATSGATEQYSPALLLTGSAYRSGTSAGSQTDSWSIQDQPVTAASATTTSNLVFSDITNGATASADAILSSTGTLTLGPTTGETGALAFGNAINTTLTTIEAPITGTPVALTYVLPVTAPTAGQVLSSTAPSSGVATMSWVSSLTNPMTTTGDIIYGSTTATPSTPQRLSIGTAGQFLGSSGTIPQWSNTLTDNSIGTGTTTYGLELVNSTVATSGATEQYSPALLLSGTAYKSGTGAASQTDTWSIQDQTVTSATLTSSNLVFSDNTNGTAGVDATLSNLGTLTLGASSSETGSLALANGTNANLTIIQPAVGVSTITYILPQYAPTAAGQQMDAKSISVSGGDTTVTLEWNTNTTTPPQYYKESAVISSTTAIPYSKSGDWAGISSTGSFGFTPAVTGRMLITVTGDMIVDNGGGGSNESGQIQMYYGDSTLHNNVPSNGSNTPTPGTNCTAFGPPEILSVFDAQHEEEAPFTVSAYLSGLTLGDQYWIDGTVSIGNSVVTSVQIVNAEITVIELP